MPKNLSSGCKDWFTQGELDSYLSAVLEFEPEVEDSVGHFVSGELLEVQLVSLDHVLGAAAGPVQKGSANETKMK